MVGLIHISMATVRDGITSCVVQLFDDHPESYIRDLQRTLQILEVWPFECFSLISLKSEVLPTMLNRFVGNEPPKHCFGCDGQSVLNIK